MSNRLSIQATEPAAFNPMMGLERYLGDSDIEPKLRQLIKVRASMLNNCAYCIQMHTDEALKLDESLHRLMALSAWTESPLFNERERAVLQLTDEVTLISAEGVTDETYNLCLDILGEQVLSQCIMQVVTINAWNRIAVATKMTHE